jgi:hypothetical protein
MKSMEGIDGGGVVIMAYDFPCCELAHVEVVT